jgi:hypothetical protein
MLMYINLKQARIYMTQSPHEKFPKFAFSNGRRTSEVALAELERVTSLEREDLYDRMPELLRTDLAFVVGWASDKINVSEFGEFNSTAVKDFAIVKIPILSVDGTTGNNIDGINRSYAVNTATGEAVGDVDYFGAENYLVENFATARDLNSQLTLCRARI